MLLSCVVISLSWRGARRLKWSPDPRGEWLNKVHWREKLLVVEEKHDARAPKGRIFMGGAALPRVYTPEYLSPTTTETSFLLTTFSFALAFIAQRQNSGLYVLMFNSAAIILHSVLANPYCRAKIVKRNPLCSEYIGVWIIKYDPTGLGWRFIKVCFRQKESQTSRAGPWVQWGERKKKMHMWKKYK